MQRWQRRVGRIAGFICGVCGQEIRGRLRGGHRVVIVSRRRGLGVWLSLFESATVGRSTSSPPSARCTVRLLHPHQHSDSDCDIWLALRRSRSDTDWLFPRLASRPSASPRRGSRSTDDCFYITSLVHHHRSLVCCPGLRRPP